MEKEKVLNLIKNVLVHDGRVVFGYAYGSFVEGKSFRDIDIGVYVNDSERNPFIISSDLKTQLSHLSKKEGLDFTADQFDVRVINHAPFTFLKRMFKEGVLLIDLDFDLRTDIVEHVSLMYRECAGILAEVSWV